HGGSIYRLVQDLKRERGFDIRRESMRGRHADPAYSEKDQNGPNNTPGTPLPGEDTIEKRASALISNKTRPTAPMEPQRPEQQTTIEWQLGWDGSRYTIPVRDADGVLVNVRRYQMGGGHTNKMLNLPGHGSAALFRPDILRDNDRIVITEGETDCILLNQTGIP